MSIANLLSRLAVTAVALGAGATLPVCVGHAAESANATLERTITVSGDGQAKAVPNQAHLSAGVVSQGRKAADALSANTRAMNGVFAALRRLGIPDKSIQTSDFSIAPQYQTDRSGDTNTKILGYQVSNEVRVTVDDPGKLGTALDALVSSGSNSIGSIEFTIRDPKPLLAQARADAMKDAISRAQTYAKAGGFALGPIVSAAEAGVEMPQPVYRAARIAAAPAAAPPMAAGEDTLSASVSVTFAIR
jgi:uncharacterized protein